MVTITMKTFQDVEWTKDAGTKDAGRNNPQMDVESPARNHAKCRLTILCREPFIPSVHDRLFD
jgi:hypothetical protein